MKRRNLLGILGGAMAGLAGCVGSIERKPVSSDDSDTGGSDGIDGSTFYKSVSLNRDNPQELIVRVSDALDVNEARGGTVKADSLVLLTEGAWVAERTPVYDMTEYRFTLPSDGAYTLVATGSGSNGGDFPDAFEFETILEFSVERERVQINGVYYTKQDEEI